MENQKYSSFKKIIQSSQAVCVNHGKWKPYFSMEEVSNCDSEAVRPFIIANERKFDIDAVTIERAKAEKKKIKERSFYYIIFDSFDEFLENRQRFPFCHETFIDHRNTLQDNSFNNPKWEIKGRLAFDFDIKPKNLKIPNLLQLNGYQVCEIDMNNILLLASLIPKDFKERVQKIIYETVDEMFVDVDHSKFKFVWMSSKNSSKLFSKHLVVKNLYFEDRVSMTKLFNMIFIKRWNVDNDWIDGNDLVDGGITNNKQFRMLGSYKLENPECVLELDVSDDITNIFSFTDSLIRIYRKKDEKEEQLVHTYQVRNNVIPNFKRDNLFTVSKETGEIELTLFNKLPELKGVKGLKNNRFYEMMSKQEYDIRDISTKNYLAFPYEIYKCAFDALCNIYPGAYKINKIKDNRIETYRNFESYCVICKENHINNNIFLSISTGNGNNSSLYYVYYRCWHVPNQRMLMAIIENPMNCGNPYFTIHDNFKNGNQLPQLPEFALINNNEENTKESIEKKQAINSWMNYEPSLPPPTSSRGIIQKIAMLKENYGKAQMYNTINQYNNHLQSFRGINNNQNQMNQQYQFPNQMNQFPNQMNNQMNNQTNNQYQFPNQMNQFPNQTNNQMNNQYQFPNQMNQQLPQNNGDIHNIMTMNRIISRRLNRK